MEERDATEGETEQWTADDLEPSRSAKPESEPEEIGEQTSEWVITPPPEVADQEEPARAKPKTRKPKPKPRAKPAESEPQAESEAEREVAELRARVAELEAALASAQARAEQVVRAEPAEEPVRPVEAPVGRARPTADGPADINAAGYEDLRELGLSVAESARLIAIRDVRGGIRSLDELDDVGDLPAERLTELKSRLRV
ncbi:MAG: Helix-hairpin-helix motif [Solirubrobacterales bacterium]|jgi:DNA uptake protein ComE-like DNA-binding protein|nr:Helix-hairpin-helix motif [Solirubrobacterales bacterium]